MSTNNFVCARCNSEIKIIVESCTVCKKDFHPCCVKYHKYIDENNKSVKCTGPFEKLNLQISHKRKSINSPLVSTRISTVSSRNDKEKNVIDILEGLVDKIDKQYENKLLVSKEFVNNLIQLEIKELRSSLLNTIQQEISKSINEVKELLVKELTQDKEDYRFFVNKECQEIKNLCKIQLDVNQLQATKISFPSINETDDRNKKQNKINNKTDRIIIKPLKN